MSMVPFMSKFPDLGARETRTVTVLNKPELPEGQYGFIEFYCDEPGCDCRRVLIRVVSPETGNRLWASINYGWEDQAYYRQWGMPDADLDDAVGPILDPINPQSQYAGEFLAIFQRMVEEDKAYVDRLKRHYAMFRKASRPNLRTRRAKR